MGTIHLANNLFQKLLQLNYYITTIESCTGGLLANLITDISGSSQVFWGGRVVYDNKAKIALGVKPSIIESYGVVSYETAHSLAENGLLELKRSYMNNNNNNKHFICVATTGLAERNNENNDNNNNNNNKEGGVCWIGIASSNKDTIFVEKIDASPLLSRKETKLEFAKRAFELVEKHL